MAFVHLHTHTAYSLLDGEATIPKLVDRAKELGQTALAITDHGVMFGVIEFYQYAKKQGIKPVIGCEVYTAARTRLDKTYEKDSNSGHLILLAKNNTGYKNLMNIVSVGFVDGFYYRPRIDSDILRQYSEGVIALSACMSGDIPALLLAGNYEGAKNKALEFMDIFGKDNFFIELQDHGIPEQAQLCRQLIRLSEELGLSLVATNDIHYAEKSDAQYQDILMCIQTGKNLADEDRMQFATDEFYLKSEDEMKEIFSHVPEAIDNTQIITDMCNVEFNFNETHLPEFKIEKNDLPLHQTEKTKTEGDDTKTEPSFRYLRELCYAGYNERYSDDSNMERLIYELEMIRKMGYVDYFLIVWDFIRYAKECDIAVGPGRGSAAGSIVSYCLGITNIDPVKYTLLFERFLNPERISMPDIDIDFCYRNRQKVIDYVIEKYGHDHVSQIITFGTMAAKGVVRDVGRVMNMPYSYVDSVAKQIPNDLGMTLKNALIFSPKLKEMYDSDDNVKELLDKAAQLEGLPRHASTHAAGVVITKEPISNYVPLYRRDDVISTQFPMGTVEKLGLLKMDFLGLRTLTVIRDAVNNIKESRGIEIDIDNLDLSDKAAFELISAGNTDGVFQLESVGMRQFMRELKPNSLEDIIAGGALYRPGPMDSIPTYIARKNNPALIKYKHPKLEPILNMTYGCIVYQEQVMQIVRQLGGYSLGRADLVRRAMSKKIGEVMAKEKINFIHGIVNDDGTIELDGAIRRGVDEDAAAAIFDEMMNFASYAFNKSHAAAYALITYQTAYLKAHYPAEFMAALLSSVIDRTDSVTKYIADCKRMSIKILPPDINKSRHNFTNESDNIRFGLTAVKSVGIGFITRMINERCEGGEFKSFTDFCKRMASKRQLSEFAANTNEQAHKDNDGARAIKKSATEALIRAGAFDSLGVKRSVLMRECSRVIDTVLGELKTKLVGQLGLFEEDAAADNFADVAEFPMPKLLEMEKETLGFYVSGSPLDDYAEALCQYTHISELNNKEAALADGENVNIAGIIISKKTKLTKNGKYMAFIRIEDMTGSIEVIVFSKELLGYENILYENNVIAINGNLDRKEDEEYKVLLRYASPLTPTGNVNGASSAVRRLYLRLNSDEHSKRDECMMVFQAFPGDVEVRIYYMDTKETVALRDRGSVNDCILRKLMDILGDDNVKLSNLK